MSYILEALKKANAERELERGETPGLHTQPVRDTSASSIKLGEDGKKQRWLLLALASALFLCIFTLGTMFWSRTDTPTTVPPTLTPSAPSAVAVPMPARLASGASETAANAGIEPPNSQAKPARSPASEDGARLPPAPKSTAPPERLMERAQAATRDKPARSADSPPNTTAGNQGPIPMPPSVKKALPPLVVSGSTYSDNPAYRMLIINGQVYREGDFPAPELKLEQVRPKSALLRYKGTLYVWSY